MKIVHAILFGLLGLIGFAGYKIAFAVNANPVPGSVWTWLGPTFGADWVLGATGLTASACPQITLFGGSGDGVSDNVAAWNAALAAAPADKPCIQFPAGTFLFSARMVASLSSNNQVFSLSGAAPDTTTLIWPAGGGIRVVGTANSTAFHIRDVSLVTGASNVGIGFEADWSTHHNNNMASSTIDRVKVSGDVVSTGSGHFWATGIRLNGISTVNFNSVDIWGQGGTDPTAGDDLRIEAPGSNASFIYNIINSNFYNALHGINYGGSVQGVAIANVNFTLNHIGIYVGPDTGGAQAQLSVTNSQFDNQGDNILVDTGSNLSHGIFTGNIFYIQPSTAGIHLKAGGNYQVRGNNFGPTAPFSLNGATGLLAENTSVNIADGNMCVTITTCVWLTNTANGWRVSNTWTNGITGTVTVKNDALENASVITGLTQAMHQTFPNAISISAAVSASGPNGLIKLTTVQTTAELMVDQIIMLIAPGLTNQPGLYKISSIPDANTVILAGSAFGGALTSNGTLTVLP